MGRERTIVFLALHDLERAKEWREIDHITIRGFLSHLYEKGLGKTSVARSLAAVRSLYRWLAQEGVVV